MRNLPGFGPCAGGGRAANSSPAEAVMDKADDSDNPAQPHPHTEPLMTETVQMVKTDLKGMITETEKNCQVKGSDDTFNVAEKLDPTTNENFDKR